MQNASNEKPPGLEATVETLVRLAEAQQETNRALAAQMEELLAATKKSLSGSSSPRASRSDEIPESVDSGFLSSDPKLSREESFRPVVDSDLSTCQARDARLKLTHLLPGLPEVDDGAFADPETCDGTLEKYAKQVPIPRFVMTTEDKLLEWGEEVAALVASVNIPASAFRRLCARSTSEALKAAFLAFDQSGIPLQKVSQLIEVLARSHYGGGYLRSLTEEIRHPKSSPSVTAAHLKYSQQLARYVRLCRAHDRENSLSSDDLREAYLAILPDAVRADIGRKALSKKWRVDRCHKEALLVEDGLSAYSQIRGEESGTVFFGAREREPDGCRGCRGNHLHRNCPDYQVKCKTCKRYGHRSDNCRAHVTPDSGGNPRIVTNQSPSGKVWQDFLFDNTRRDRLNTMQKHLDTELQTLDRPRHTGREHEVGDKRPPPPERPRRPVLCAEEGEAEGEGMEEDAPDGMPLADDQDEVGEDVCLYALAAGKDLQKINMSFPNGEATVCLDGGCSKSMMSFPMPHVWGSPRPVSQAPGCAALGAL